MFENNLDVCVVDNKAKSEAGAGYDSILQLPEIKENTEVNN